MDDDTSRFRAPGPHFSPEPPAFPARASLGDPPIPPLGSPPDTRSQPSSRKKKRGGPGWSALAIGMILSALTSVAVVLLLIGGQSVFDPSGVPGSSWGFAGGEQSQGDVELVDPVPVSSGGPDWQEVAEAVLPATVTIMVNGGGEDATGSGVVFDASGNIITNHHVVSSAYNGGTITVAMSDGRLFNADMVGSDPTTDLAVIVLQDVPKDLVAARLGDSRELEVGEPVMAIGAPLGLSDTVTTGIISALDRPVAAVGTGKGQNDLEDEVVITNAIQIDASINPGNSGGPLFDASGAVIGINSSIASTSVTESEAGSIGLGFAIPVDLVQSVTSQIISEGSARHALLGVEIQTGAAQTETEARLGASIAGVVPGGAADSAGLQVGDVIVGIEGQPVTSGPALTGYVRRHKPGDEVELLVVRGGQEIEVVASLQEK